MPSPKSPKSPALSSKVRTAKKYLDRAKRGGRTLKTCVVRKRTSTSSLETSVETRGQKRKKGDASSSSAERSLEERPKQKKTKKDQSSAKKVAKLPGRGKGAKSGGKKTAEKAKQTEGSQPVVVEMATSTTDLPRPTLPDIVLPPVDPAEIPLPEGTPPPPAFTRADSPEAPQRPADTQEPADTQPSVPATPRRSSRPPPRQQHGKRPAPGPSSLATGLEEYNYPAVPTETTTSHRGERRHGRRADRGRDRTTPSGPSIPPPPILGRDEPAETSTPRTARRALDRSKSRPVAVPGRSSTTFKSYPVGAEVAETDELLKITRYKRNIETERKETGEPQFVKLAPAPSKLSDVERISAEALAWSNTGSLVHKGEWGGKVSRDVLFRKIGKLPNRYGVMRKPEYKRDFIAPNPTGLPENMQTVAAALNLQNNPDRAVGLQLYAQEIFERDIEYLPGYGPNSLFSAVLAQVSGYSNTYGPTFLRRWCVDEMAYDYERYANALSKKLHRRGLTFATWLANCVDDRYVATEDFLPVLRRLLGPIAVITPKRDIAGEGMEQRMLDPMQATHRLVDPRDGHNMVLPDIPIVLVFNGVNAWACTKPLTGTRRADLRNNLVFQQGINLRYMLKRTIEQHLTPEMRQSRDDLLEALNKHLPMFQPLTPAETQMYSGPEIQRFSGEHTETIHADEDSDRELDVFNTNTQKRQASVTASATQATTSVVSTTAPDVVPPIAAHVTVQTTVSATSATSTSTSVGAAATSTVTSTVTPIVLPTPAPALSTQDLGDIGWDSDPFTDVEGDVVLPPEEPIRSQQDSRLRVSPRKQRFPQKSPARLSPPLQLGEVDPPLPAPPGPADRPPPAVEPSIVVLIPPPQKPTQQQQALAAPKATVIVRRPTKPGQRGSLIPRATSSISSGSTSVGRGGSSTGLSSHGGSSTGSTGRGTSTRRGLRRTRGGSSSASNVRPPSATSSAASTGSESRSRVSLVVRKTSSISTRSSGPAASTQDREYPCAFNGPGGPCKKVFKRHDHLLDHYQSVDHRNAPATCSVCGKKYSHERTLAVHMRTHTGTQRFTCDSCGFSCERRRQFEKHLERHKKGLSVKSQDGLFHCEKCGKGFERAVNLRQHRHNVSDCEKTRFYLCPQGGCGASYKTLTGVINHILRSHGSQDHRRLLTAVQGRITRAKATGELPQSHDEITDIDDTLDQWIDDVQAGDESGEDEGHDEGEEPEPEVSQQRGRDPILAGAVTDEERPVLVSLAMHGGPSTTATAQMDVIEEQQDEEDPFTVEDIVIGFPDPSLPNFDFGNVDLSPLTQELDKSLEDQMRLTEELANKEAQRRQKEKEAADKGRDDQQKEQDVEYVPPAKRPRPSNVAVESSTTVQSQPIQTGRPRRTLPPSDADVQAKERSKRIAKHLAVQDKLITDHRERAKRLEEQEKRGRKKGERKIRMNTTTNLYESTSSSDEETATGRAKPSSAPEQESDIEEVQSSSTPPEAVEEDSEKTKKKRKKKTDTRTDPSVRDLTEAHTSSDMTIPIPQELEGMSKKDIVKASRGTDGKYTCPICKRPMGNKAVILSVHLGVIHGLN